MTGKSDATTLRGDCARNFAVESDASSWAVRADGCLVGGGFLRGNERRSRLFDDNG